MNIRNVLMPLLLSVCPAEAEPYECCLTVCISIVLVSLVRAWYQSRFYQPATALSTCHTPLTSTGEPQGQCDICIHVDM